MTEGLLWALAGAALAWLVRSEIARRHKRRLMRRVWERVFGYGFDPLDTAPPNTGRSTERFSDAFNEAWARSKYPLGALLVFLAIGLVPGRAGALDLSLSLQNVATPAARQIIDDVTAGLNQPTPVAQPAEHRSPKPKAVGSTPAGRAGENTGGGENDVSRCSTMTLSSVDTNCEAGGGPSAPTPEPTPTSSGRATWYGYALAGNATASGEIFDPALMTAAHRTLPFGTVLNVCYQDRCVRVKVNDRGPAKWTGKDIDLSKAAFARLAPTSRGVINVTWSRP